MYRSSWQKTGKEPDYRFSLANERTFLSWIRTALSFVAGGVLLEQFATKLQPRTGLVALAIGLTLMSAALSVIAYLRWKHNEIAMRSSLPLPSNMGIPLLAVAMLVVSVVIAWLING